VNNKFNFNNLLTYLLHGERVLLEKLTGLQLVKKFHGTPRFITALTSVRLTTYLNSGPGISVVIATGYGLDGAGIESRRGARFSAPVQTGPGAHPASCRMGTGSFPW